MASSAASTALVEKSFCDAISAIGNASDLSPGQKRHWTCSLRMMGKALDRPLELLPARWTAVRLAIFQLHHAPLKVRAKTLANHRSNVRAALDWFAGTADVPPRGTPLTHEWTAPKASIAHHRTRVNLYSLMRFCSGRCLAPTSMSRTPSSMSFMAYRAATTACDAGSAARRRVARAWNDCVGTIEGGPDRKLNEPPTKGYMAGPKWEEFPAQLREDIERYLSALGKIRRGPSGRRYRPCKPSTIKVRRAKLIAFARKAVTRGISIDALASIADLLDPATVEAVLDAYWNEEGELPEVYTIELAAMLVSVAKQLSCLPAADAERLEEVSAELAAYRSRRVDREEYCPDPACP